MNEPKKPQRRHELELTIDADSEDELMHALKEFSTKIALGEMAPSGVSGGCGHSWVYRHTENPDQTPDGYQKDLRAWLDWNHAQEKAEEQNAKETSDRN